MSLSEVGGWAASMNVPWADDSSSDEELLLLSLLKRSKGKWVHDINKERESFGEFHHLMKRLCADKRKFQEYYQLEYEEFYDLLTIIEGDISKNNTSFRRSVTAEERLAVTLRFLATGNSFRNLASSFWLGKTTISEIIQEVCEAIWKNLQPVVLPEPNEFIWRASEHGFREGLNFPHCCGALDGKHIQIKAPPKSGSLYFNYKKEYSIVLLAVVDSHYRFLSVDIGSYGKNSDGNVFMHSAMGKRFHKNELGIPPPEEIDRKTFPYVIVGDKAFPLEINLMRPYPKSKLTIRQRIFNYRLSRCHRVVENAFGILAGQWRVFERPLNIKVELTEMIVKATTVLHNFIRKDKPHDSPINTMYLDPSAAPSGTFKDLNRRQQRKCKKEAFVVRQAFMDYFTSDGGLVEWQFEAVLGN